MCYILAHLCNIVAAGITEPETETQGEEIFCFCYDRHINYFLNYISFRESFSAMYDTAVKFLLYLFYCNLPCQPPRMVSHHNTRCSEGRASVTSMATVGVENMAPMMSLLAIL